MKSDILHWSAAMMMMVLLLFFMPSQTMSKPAKMASAHAPKADAHVSVHLLLTKNQVS